MSIRPLILVALALAPCFSAFAESGGNSGGGGGFIITQYHGRTPDGRGGHMTGELADLWLARRGRGPWMTFVGNPPKQKFNPQPIIKAKPDETPADMVRYALNRAKQINPEYGRLLERALAHVTKRVVRNNEEILLKDDTGIISLPSGFQNLPLARYSDVQDYLTINVGRENLLPVVDKGALPVHEAVYYMKRFLSEETTSYNTQTDVGILFSTGALPSLGKLESAILCTSIEENYPGYKDSIVFGLKGKQLVSYAFVGGLKLQRRAFTLRPEEIDIMEISEEHTSKKFREVVRSGQPEEWLGKYFSGYERHLQSIKCVPY